MNPVIECMINVAFNVNLTQVNWVLEYCWLQSIDYAVDKLCSCVGFGKLQS